MFPSGFKIGRILGIDIVINITWALIFILLAISFGDIFSSFTTNHDPFPTPFPGGIWPWVAGIITALIFFACLLVHELSHSLVARRHEVEIKRITLFIFGGVAEMTGEVPDAGSEFKMAAAGPLASLVISGLFFGFFFLFFHLKLNTLILVPLFYLGALNMGVCAFNLLPGFPLDGGRILRAFLWKKTGDLEKSTRIATVAGKGLALVMAAGGLYFLIIGDYVSGIWFVFIGVFLYQFANMSYKQTLLRLAAVDTKVKDIMYTDIPFVDPETTLTNLRNNFFGPYRLPVLPIKDGDMLIGVVSEKDLMGVAGAEWDLLNAGRIAKPVPMEKTVSPETPLSEALKKISDSDDYILIGDGNDILGILTKQEIIRYFEMRVKLREK